MPELVPVARFRRRKAAVKMHTLLDLRGNIPTFIRITDGKVHDVNVLDQIMPEAGAIYVMDRGYIDFERLYRFTLESAFFVVRTKSNVLLQRRYSHPVDSASGVRSDQTVVLASLESASVYPGALRKVCYVDAETGKRLVFLTKQLRAASRNHLRHLQAALADRTVLQMDQAAPAHQGFLRHERECRENPNLDRRLGLCAGGHRAKTPRHRSYSLPNPTGPQSYPVRENPHFTGTSTHRLPRRFIMPRQPNESVRLIAGQQ